MSTEVHPLPPSPACLTRSYASRRIKGGTVIAEEVIERSEHERRLLDPDSYRECVTPCTACKGTSLHAHCFRNRTLRSAARGEPSAIITIRLYLCTCGAVFTVLPAFAARHLWRAWKTVEATVTGKEAPPRTTARRWLSRIATDAAVLVQAFVSLAQGVLPPAFILRISKASTRWEVIEAARDTLECLEGRVLSTIASTIHRLVPGIRLL